MTSIQDVKNFISFASKELKLTSLPKINFVGSAENSLNAFGHFNSSNKGSTINVRITDRHPIDVMRTLAHELIHYRQLLRGSKAGELMKEDEANALAGRLMRDFDKKHSRVFKDKAIKEDAGVGIAAIGANHTGGGIENVDPLFKKKSILSRLFTQKKSSLNSSKPLRAVLKQELGNESRSDKK